MAFATGKVILLGEHAVVYGEPALAGAVSAGVRATMSRGNELLRLDIPTWNTVVTVDVEQGLTADSTPLAQALHQWGRNANATNQMTFTATIELPPGGGLGCSAALGVALTRALDEHVAPQTSVYDRALVWERVFHGNPSGVDVALATEGGLGLFTRATGLTRMTSAVPLFAVLAHTGEPSRTDRMVGHVRNYLDDNPLQGKALLSAIGQVTVRGAEAIQKADLVALGQAMNSNQVLLHELGVSTSGLDQTCAALRESGALGAKLTGAGGGGAAIGLAKDRFDAHTIALAMQSRTAPRTHTQVLVTEIGVEICT